MANHLPTEKKITVVSMLAEGCSIRSVERITGINRNTIMGLGVRVGNRCIALQHEKMRNIQSTDFQIDEIWGFILKKRKQAKTWDLLQGVGDVWTFIALARETKIIPSFHVGQRTMLHAQMFLRDLESRLASRPQISADGLAAYRETMGEVFVNGVDFGQVVKTYSITNLNKDAASRYSPAEVVKTEKKIVCGDPDPLMISTSHVEKQNHTLRMHCRRLTRLTNAFSKKFENFRAAVALNFAYYNFCKRHITIKTTPARAEGIEDHEWTVVELVEKCGE